MKNKLLIVLILLMSIILCACGTGKGNNANNSQNTQNNSESTPNNTETQEKEISAHLFAVLRSFDTEQMEVIYSESFEETKLAGAIMNRLRKAAGYHTLQV